MRFAVVVAVGALSDAEDRRRLDAFGYGKAAEEVPPLLEVLNKFSCRGEETGCQSGFAAKVLL